MDWTRRSDIAAACGADPGPVADREDVARLLHSTIVDPAAAAFSRKELEAPPPATAFDNTCGFADGCSVHRSTNLSNEEIAARARVQAAVRAGREGRGAIVAAVSDLRAIPCSLDPNGRAVYVYDDPMADNREHAVLRVSQALPRTDFVDIRDQIIRAFKSRVAA